MQAPSYADILRAAPVVRAALPPSPLIHWPLLSKRLGFSFALKHENHLPTGAFKVRGGVYLVSRLDPVERARGVMGCTTGNHGQSLAFACQQAGIGCRLVVPRGVNPAKAASMRALGAELIEEGVDFQEAKEHCERLVAESGARYVHSANEPDLIAGVGTIGLEILNADPTVDVILVPIGLGSGACGIALAAAARHPRLQVIGVQSEGASAVADSWTRGEMVSYPAIDTFAEGLATRAPAQLTLEILRRHLHAVVLVSDQELRTAMRWILEDTRNLPEPAGAASTAAAWKLRSELAGRKVVGILSGGNIDAATLRASLAESSE